jgi:hypothetical protein
VYPAPWLPTTHRHQSQKQSECPIGARWHHTPLCSSRAASAGEYANIGRHWPCAAWRADPKGRNSAAPYDIVHIHATRCHTALKLDSKIDHLCGTSDIFRLIRADFWTAARFSDQRGRSKCLHIRHLAVVLSDVPLGTIPASSSLSQRF